jgi:hypothetical protein
MGCRKHEQSKIMASVKDLRAAAKQRGVKGYYKMNKAQLMAVVGGGTNTKSGATGNRRAQATARKSGAAVSFGADKLAAKYGVDKKTLVSGTRSALRKAEKANGAPLTPQQKRKVAAQHLSSATKIDRTTSGTLRKMKRETPKAYNRTALGIANLKSGSGARKKGVSMIMDVEKGAGKRSSNQKSEFKAPVQQLISGKKKTDRIDANVEAIKRKSNPMRGEMDGRSKSSKQVKRKGREIKRSDMSIGTKRKTTYDKRYSKIMGKVIDREEGYGKYRKKGAESDSAKQRILKNVKKSAWSRVDSAFTESARNEAMQKSAEKTLERRLRRKGEDSIGDGALANSVKGKIKDRNAFNDRVRESVKAGRTSQNLADELINPRLAQKKARIAAAQQKLASAAAGSRSDGRNPLVTATSRPASKRNKLDDAMWNERMTNGKTPAYRDMEAKRAGMSSYPKARIKRSSNRFGAGRKAKK